MERDLHFAGFVIISCPLKPDSLSVIQMLKASAHHITMVTGDNPLTACHVSNLLGITRKNVPVLVLTPPNELRKLNFSAHYDTWVFNINLLKPKMTAVIF